MLTRILSVYAKLKHAQKAYGVSLGSVVGKALYYRFIKGLLLDEQLATGLLSQSITFSPDQQVAARLQMEPWLRSINRYPREVLADKAIFSQFIKGIDVLAPKTLLTFYPSDQGAKAFAVTADQNVLNTKEVWLDYMAKNLPVEFIVKPAEGQGGKDIHVYRASPSGGYRCQENELSLEQIYERVVTKQIYGKSLIQNLAKNHADFQLVSETNALECLRILTVLTKTKGVQIFSSEAKFTVDKTKDVDNFHGGVDGNILCKVDNATGRVLKAYRLDLTKLQYMEKTHHPNTGHELVGWQIPLFAEALEAAKKSHRSVMPMKVIGWDIAITPEGPMIIEGNYLWGGSSLTMPWFCRADMKILRQMLAS